ncbi:MAG TPA: M14 family metallopeptidase, partial [Planctomycetota bacterium]|nr:M14 family metallopeptidase [Planctomycetota bacterium]
MNPLTVAEKSGYRETSRHADVLRFIDELRVARPVFRVESMGRSAQGQEMPVLVFGERPGTPVVLVIANIHAGEVEGKEALLMLARDLPASYFEKLTLLFIPDYNPDGNDRIDVNNRKLDLSTLEGQIGPEGGVGTRTTGEGINLNRDYMKMEAVESRNLSALQAKWKPHLTVDSHTTDGSIHRYALTFDTSHLPCEPARYAYTRMLPDVSRRLERRTGLKTFFYGNFVDEKDPSLGWMTYSHLPRYGSHYRGLTGRLDILLETYSYISFKERVFTTVEILKDIFDYAIEHAAELRTVCTQGEAARPDPVGIAYGAPEPVGDCEIHAWDMESQLARRIPGREPRVYRMPHLARFV